MPQDPLDGRAAKIKTLFVATMQNIYPVKASDAELKEIEPKLEIAAQAIVEAFDILNS